MEFWTIRRSERVKSITVQIRTSTVFRTTVGNEEIECGVRSKSRLRQDRRKLYTDLKLTVMGLGSVVENGPNNIIYRRINRKDKDGDGESQIRIMSSVIKKCFIQCNTVK